ncbi:MAG: sigma-70 family RNA polymerase sigma factor [Isosphaeraceae bacterium]
MAMGGELPFVELLLRARSGDEAALGCLLESYNGYLRIVAASLLRVAPRMAVDASDVVQETKLKACRGFPQFGGDDESQLVAWLRRILVNHVFTLCRKRGHAGRAAESLEALLDRSSSRAHRALAATGSSPSSHESRREQAVRVADALDCLEPDHREVLVLHYLDDLPHAEIGRRMNRSEGASRMLLMRAAMAFERKLRGAE